MRNTRTRSGALGMGMLLLWSATAFATHNSYSSGGTYTTKGVLCQYEATGTSKLTTGFCSFEAREALLLCTNPEDNQEQGVSAIQTIVFGEASASGKSARGQQRSRYNIVTNADGVSTSDAECDASASCQALRQFCQSHTWVPVDVVPVKFYGTFSTYSCASQSTCPCDPDGVTGPRCLDHITKTAVIDPLGPPDTVCCTLPHSETFQFGEARRYECVPTTSAQACLGSTP